MSKILFMFTVMLQRILIKTRFIDKTKNFGYIFVFVYCNNEAGEVMWDPYAEVQSVVLPNGLTIYCSEWPNREFEQFHFLIHSGSNQDPEDKPGIAHFVEHVVSSNSIETKVQMEEFFRPFGGRVDFGRTGSLSSKYAFMLPIDPSVIAGALHRFGHMLFGAKLEHEIEAERTIILAEFRRKYPSKRRWEDHVEETALLTHHGKLAKMEQNIGTIDSIQSITKADLQKFYDAHYTPANMSVVCVGGMSAPDVVSLFEASPFVQFIPGTRTPLPKVREDVGTYTQRRKEVLISERNPNVNRTNCKFTTKGMIPGTVHRDIVVQTLTLLEEKLTRELREIRGWVYHVDVSSVAVQRTYYVVTIFCDGVESSVIDQIEEVIDATIGSLHQHEREFHEMRQSIRAGFIYFDPSVDGIKEGIIDDLVLLQRIRTIVERRASVEAVTFQDVLDLLPFLASENRWTCITRP